MTYKASIHISRTIPATYPHGTGPGSKDAVETVIDVTDLEAAPHALGALLEGLASTVDPQAAYVSEDEWK